MPQKTGVVLLLAGVMTVSSVAADDDTALARCVSIDDAGQRLACYDEIAGRVTTADESTAAPAPIPEDYGAEQLSQDNPDSKVEKPVLVKVTSCRRDVRRKYYFYLENGQVWRQARSGSYRHRTLTNPTVTLVPKALNTWSLEIEGLNRTVRVKRIK